MRLNKDRWTLQQYVYEKEISYTWRGPPDYYDFVYIGNGYNTEKVIRMKEYLGTNNFLAPGWYATIPPKDYIDIHNWCEKNIKDFTMGTYFISISEEKDVTLFLLRWQ